MTVPFSNQLVGELIQSFWAAWQGGEFMTDASAVAGTHRQRGLAWVRQAGGVRPRRGRDLQGRYLSFGEREEVALGRAGRESIRSISRRLGSLFDVDDHSVRAPECSGDEHLPQERRITRTCRS